MHVQTENSCVHFNRSTTSIVQIRALKRRILLVLIAASGLSTSAWGQSFSVSVADLPLDDALLHLAEKAGVDVVFAHRFTRSHNTTCVYDGPSVDEAMTCLLRDLPLRAERTGARQWVIVPQVTRAVDSGPETGKDARSLPLTGTVFDGATGAPLPGANVVVLTAGVGATTGLDGRFELRHDQTDSLVVRASFVGYETKVVRTTGRDVLQVGLDPVAVQSDEVVVEGSRGTLEDSSPIAGSIAVLERQNSQDPSFLAEDDLFQSLQWLPAVRQSGEFGGYLVVRGSGPEQSLHMLDGAPLYHPWHTMGLLSTLQTEALKDAQLYSGTIPAEFGGRLSAVLDTRLKDGNRVDPRLIASVGSMSSQFVAEAPVSEHLSFMLAGRRSYADGLLNSAGVGLAERTTLQNSDYADFNAKVTARPWRRHEFRLSYFYGRDRVPFGSQASMLESLGWNRYVVSDTQPLSNGYRWNSRLASLQHGYLRGANLLLTTTAFWSGYRASDAPDDEVASAVPYTMEVADVGLKVDADYFSSSGHTVRAGIHVTHHDFLNLLSTPSDAIGGDGLTDIGQAALEVASYVQDTWDVGPRLQIQPGLRFSAYGTSPAVHLTPRLNARFVAMPDRVVLKAGFSRQVQYVHQIRDRFTDMYGLTASRWVSVAVDGVEPAAGHQATFGAETRPVKHVELSADVYWRRFRNSLIPDVYDMPQPLLMEPSLLLSRYHQGRHRAYGLELYGSMRRGPVRYWASYAAGRSEDEVSAAGESDYVSSRFHVPHTLRGGLNWTRGRWAISVIGEIRSGYPVAHAQGRFFGDNARANPVEALGTDALGQLPVYHRLDARIGYRTELLGARWNAQFDVFNVTGARNVVGHLYEYSGRQAARNDLYGLPRLPLFKLSVEF